MANFMLYLNKMFSIFCTYRINETVTYITQFAKLSSCTFDSFIIFLKDKKIFSLESWEEVAGTDSHLMLHLLLNIVS